MNEKISSRLKDASFIVALTFTLYGFAAILAKRWEFIFVAIILWSATVFFWSLNKQYSKASNLHDEDRKYQQNSIKNLFYNILKLSTIFGAGVYMLSSFVYYLNENNRAEFLTDPVKGVVDNLSQLIIMQGLFFVVWGVPSLAAVLYIRKQLN